jgi:hypothetical protein
MAYTQENVIRIWDDDTGYCIEVGEDSDGLSLLCLRWGESPKNWDGESHGMDAEQARLVGEALIRFAKEKESKGE